MNVLYCGLFEINALTLFKYDKLNVVEYNSVCCQHEYKLLQHITLFIETVLFDLALVTFIKIVFKNILFQIVHHLTNKDYIKIKKLGKNNSAQL